LELLAKRFRAAAFVSAFRRSGPAGTVSGRIYPAELGALLRAIEGYNGQPTTRLALQLSALLFVRPGELRLAR
jgi:hypothetical protein